MKNFFANFWAALLLFGLALIIVLLAVLPWWRILLFLLNHQPQMEVRKQAEHILVKRSGSTGRLASYFTSYELDWQVEPKITL